jgi:hypothetical protein
MVHVIKLLPNDRAPLYDPEKYQILVRKLNYLTVTRPTIANPVSIVSQFMSAQHITHWDATIQILKYLKRSPSKGLILF